MRVTIACSQRPAALRAPAAPIEWTEVGWGEAEQAERWAQAIPAEVLEALAVVTPFARRGASEQEVEN